MEGTIFNIKRFAIHDGPGIRVTFFMKGCPLGCWWCHNPEGISPHIENIERVDRIGNREFKVSEAVGLKYSVNDLKEVVDKERIFIDESGGGVTYSGGEPLMQSKFVIESMRVFRESGIHTCLDTSGHADTAIIDSVLPLTDLFLFDIKHLDDSKHKEYTGVSNKRILSNYKRILDNGNDVIIRVPIVPGFNDDPGHLDMLREFFISMKRENLIRIDLLPYHKIGSSKYRRFGLEYRMDNIEQPSGSRMNELKGFFSEPGFRIKIGG